VDPPYLGGGAVRTVDSGAPEGDRTEIVRVPSDIFDTIARNIFETRGMIVDGEWVAAIAAEYRRAMAELHVEIGPAERPKVDRSDTGAVLMLLAGIENGDLTVTHIDQPLVDGRVRSAGTWTLYVGLFELHVQMVRWSGSNRYQWTSLDAVVLSHGQLVTTKHMSRLWLRSYQPPAKFLADINAYSGQGTLAWSVECPPL
jgi:hypothetical protein